MALATGGIIHEVSCFWKPRGSSRSGATWPPTCNLQPGYRVDMECMPGSSRMYCSRLRGTEDKEDRKRSAVLRFSILRFLEKWIVLFCRGGETGRYASAHKSDIFISSSIN